jgi:hypothetical protein
VQTIFGIILGGPPPYQSSTDYYSPLASIISPLVLAYVIVTVLGKRSPTFLDAVATAVFVWVVASICDAKFQTECYSYPWTRFGCRNITGCVEAGVFTVLVTMAAILFCERSSYHFASEKGMILGFCVGYMSMFMVLPPVT